MPARPLIWTMRKYTPKIETIIDATVCTVEVLREICRAELSEDAVDKLLCNTYREFMGNSWLTSVPSDG